MEAIAFRPAPLVKLTHREINLAATHGVQRVEENRRNDWEYKYNYDRDPYSDAISGSLAELAVAKYYDIYPRGFSRAGELDTTAFEIRTTRFRDGHLLLHPEDSDSRLYVLVIDNCPDFFLAGKVLGKEGKLRKYWQERRTGRPCYWVPQNSLTEVKRNE